MATFGDIGVAAGLNILFAVAFLIAFAILRLQPINDGVYFPKWYLLGVRNGPSQQGSFVTKFVNLDWRSYIRFLNWVPDALRMPELQLIDHAGLDSAVYLRIYLLGYVYLSNIFFNLLHRTHRPLFVFTSINLASLRVHEIVLYFQCLGT